MRFVYGEPLPDGPGIACDGLGEEELQLSHFKGNRTPTQYKADTGTAIAVKFARDPAARRERYRYVTCDHYDTDAVFSVFAVLDPAQALARSGELIAAAETGDFARFTTERAFKLNAVIAGFLDHKASPLYPQLRALSERDADRLCFGFVLADLPALLDRIDEHEPLWRDEWAWYRESLEAFGKGDVSIVELSDARMSVVEADFEPHPAVVDAQAKGEMLLYVIRKETGYGYRADWRYDSWGESVSRPAPEWLSLEKLCLPLNALDPNRLGRWMNAGYGGQGRTEALAFTNAAGQPQASSLEPSEVVSRLAWFLIDRRASATG